jgi:hypothetical protein
VIEEQSVVKRGRRFHWFVAELWDEFDDPPAEELESEDDPDRTT